MTPYCVQYADAKGVVKDTWFTWSAREGLFEEEVFKAIPEDSGDANQWTGGVVLSQ